MPIQTCFYFSKTKFSELQCFLNVWVKISHTHSMAKRICQVFYA